MTIIKLTRKEYLAMIRVGGDWSGIEKVSESFNGKGYRLFVKNKVKCMKTIKKAIDKNPTKILKSKREGWEIDIAEGWKSVISKIKG
jgi:hypothetical protein